MSPFSWPVLLPSLALSSPVILDAYSGAATWTDALNRFLLVLGVCWVAVSVVHSFAFPGSAPASGRDLGPDTAETTDDAYDAYDDDGGSYDGGSPQGVPPQHRD